MPYLKRKEGVIVKNKSHIKNFIHILQELAYMKSQYDIFSDFLTLSTCAYANTIYRSEEIEAEYMKTTKKYSKDELEKFTKLLSITVLALQEQAQDFMGEVFMSCDMGSSHSGQFFTPYHISAFMAKINLGNIGATIKEKGFFSMLEPTCGSGGMVVAAYDEVRNSKYDHREVMFVQAQDIDYTCFLMAYLQLSILEIPARVIWGDSLANTTNKVLYTPAYAIYGWEEKLNYETVVINSKENKVA